MKEKSSRIRPLRLGLYLLLMGILIGWIFALAIPAAIEMELPAPTIGMLPVYGFALGAATGLGMYFIASIREVVFVLLWSVVLGAFIWFSTLVALRGVLLIVEVPLETVDAISQWVGPIAFAIGPLLGVVAVFVFGYDKLSAALTRSKPRQGDLRRAQE